VKVLRKYSKWLINQEGVVVFILFSLLLRMFSFPTLLVDNDEWTYWQIASEWMGGERLYVDLKDIKPPGIFLVFVILIKASFGKMWLARLWSAVFLGIAAWSVGEIGKYLFKSNVFLTGLFFLWSFSYTFGMALNTELFYVCFVAIGSAIYLSATNLRSTLFGIFIMGFSLTIKYVTILDIGVFILFLSLKERGENQGFVKTGLKIAKTGVLVLLPFALMNILFIKLGNSEAFLEALYTLPGKYISTRNWSKTMDSFVLYHYRFIWISILAIIGLITLEKHNRQQFTLFVLWIIGIWILILMPSRLHDHYWLQLAIPMSLLAGIGIVQWNKHSEYISLFVLASIIISGFVHHSYSRSANYSIGLVNDNMPNVVGKEIWAANSPAIYYHLNGKNCLTPYVHGSLTFDQGHLDVYSESQLDIWEKILSNVDVVVFSHGSSADKQFLETLQGNFEKYWESVPTHSIWLKTDKSQLKD